MKNFFSTLCCFWLLLPMVFAQIPPYCYSDSIPPVDRCQKACVYCNINGATGNNSAYFEGSVNGFCGTIENQFWMGFVANATSATIRVTPSNCLNGFGLQVAVLETCDGIPIACNGGLSGGGAIPVEVTLGLVIGATYYLMVDGFAGDICDYAVSVTPANALLSPNVGNISAINGPDVVCPGAVVEYQVPPVTGAGAYTWTVPPDCRVNGQSSPLTLSAQDGGNKVIIEFGTSNIGTICVSAANPCSVSDQFCKSYTVKPIPVTMLPDRNCCYEDSSCVNGLNTITYTSWMGCDSVVRFNAIIRPPIQKVLAPQMLCAGDSIDVCGEKIYQPGPFKVVCQAASGCDSTVLGQLLVAQPIAKITQFPTGCTDSLSVLAYQQNIGTFEWTNELGQSLGSGTQLIVNQSGKYFLTNTVILGNTICTATDSVEVFINEQPVITFSPQNLDGCQNSPIALVAGVQPTPIKWQWTGPDGFSSQLSMPEITTEGWYYLTVTTVNNCFSVDSILVGSNNLGAPVVTLSSGTITCCNPSTMVSALPQSGSWLYDWAGPNNFIATGADILVNVPGNYQVTITDTLTGCFSIRKIGVSAQTIPPNLSATAGIVTCANPASLSANSSDANTQFTWTGQFGFLSMQSDTVTNQSGVYQVTAFDPSNCCTSSQTLMVTEDKFPPVFQIEGSLFLKCNSKTTELTPVPATPDIFFAWQTMAWPPTGSVTVNMPGIYTLLGTGANGCTTSLTVEVRDTCTTIGLEHIEKSTPTVRIFPQPAQQFFIVNTDFMSGISAIRVQDMTGRRVFESNYAAAQTVKVAVGHLPKGVFVVSVLLENQWVSRLVLLE